MADVFHIDVNDWVQTLDKQWHQIVGIKFHTRKGIKPHPCVGRHEKPDGLIRDWSITTNDGLVLGMRDVNRYATVDEMISDEELQRTFKKKDDRENFWVGKLYDMVADYLEQKNLDLYEQAKKDLAETARACGGNLCAGS